MDKYTLLGIQIEAEGFNAEAICEIENIYNRLSKMYDCTQDELYATTALRVATRNYTKNNTAEWCRVNITIWDVDLSLTVTNEAEIRMVVEAINNYVAHALQMQSNRELIWRNLLLFCYQLNA